MYHIYGICMYCMGALVRFISVGCILICLTVRCFNFVIAYSVCIAAIYYNGPAEYKLLLPRVVLRPIAVRGRNQLCRDWLSTREGVVNVLQCCLMNLYMFQAGVRTLGRCQHDFPDGSPYTLCSTLHA